jgi:hypothetical protein
MKGRGGTTPKSTNIDQNEPKGAFVGSESVTDIAGTPPRWSKGSRRVKPSSFMAEGNSAATSLKAARTPTHWRRGGFVSAPREGPPSDANRDEPTNLRRGGRAKK